MKLTSWKWWFLWGASGLAVPIALLLQWKVFGVLFGDLEAVLWPSSIMTMALEGSTSAANILFVYAIALLANMILYGVVGLALWPIVRFCLGRDRTQQY